MHRIDTGTRAVDLFGVGKAGFRDGAPPSTLAPTELNAAWFNSVQEELCGLPESVGAALSIGNNTQLLAAIKTMVGRAQLKTALTTVRAIHDTAVGPQTLNALARSPGSAGKAIAVGTVGTIQGNTGPRSNFAAQAVAAGSSYTGDFTDITYDATLGLFIAVGKAGEIQTSTGNGTWTRRANGGADFLKVATNGMGLCVAVGKLGLIKYSTNGTTWTTATSPFGAGARTFSGVVFGAGLFVAVTWSSDIVSSPDGITWTARRNVDFAEANGEVVYDPAIGFVFSGDSAPNVFRSPDGIAWVRIHSIMPYRLIASPFGWLTMASSVDGSSANVRYSPTAVDQEADFSVDYMTSDELKWMKFIDGQLWALGATRIYLGGVL